MALHHAEKACEQGHLQGCHHQAIMMFYGLGSITKACAHDSVLHIIETGALLQETDQAVRLFERTCEMGDRDSCYMAGTHFLNQGATPATAPVSITIACWLCDQKTQSEIPQRLSRFLTARVSARMVPPASTSQFCSKVEMRLCILIWKGMHTTKNSQRSLCELGALCMERRQLKA
jgi:hypothetical protein